MDSVGSGEVERQALRYLKGHRVMTLATYGPQDLWAAAIFYANDGFDLVFLSAGHTRHAQNLAVNPRVSATIQEDYEDWPDIKGVQLEGLALLLDGEDRGKAIDLYEAKYPFIRTADAQIQRALDEVNWYRLRPDLFYFIDNSRGLGHRDEVDLHLAGRSRLRAEDSVG